MKARTKTASKIRFRAKLFRPAVSAKAGCWTFLTLPKDASAKLPSRGITITYHFCVGREQAAA
jgi:hypothetical protein